MEKDTEEPACTVVKFTDTQPAAAGPDEEDKQTVEENKENIGAQQTSADDKERDVDEKVCEKDEHKHTPRTSTCLTSPNNIVDTQVLYHYVIVIFVFFVFIMWCKIAISLFLSITGSVVALHFGKAHVQSRWEMAKFDPNDVKIPEIFQVWIWRPWLRQGSYRSWKSLESHGI